MDERVVTIPHLQPPAPEPDFQAGKKRVNAGAIQEQRAIFRHAVNHAEEAKMDAMLGMIIPWPISWAPSGWAFCDGSILSIQQNAALYSLLGTQFGGDGKTTFGLPDLRSRVIVGAGHGAGLSARSFGTREGAEATTLNLNNLPAHHHTVPGQPASSGDPDASTVPGPTAVPSKVTAAGKAAAAYNTTRNTTLLPPTDPTGVAGQAQPSPVNTMPPFQVLNYIIATQGIYPSRD